MNRQFLDAAFFGRYPDELAEIFGTAWPSFPATDFAAIREPLDFLGINYYTRGVTRHDPSAGPVYAAHVRQPGNVYTAMNWEVCAPALGDVLRWVRDRYGPVPLYVTENGAAFDDPPHPDSDVVDDPLRVAYIRDHLRAAHAAIAQGVDLRGYFAWSLFDNYEWSQGYSKRFGLVRRLRHQRRTPKRSAWFYRDVIQSGGTVLGA
jgi:beta-glucosidase